jgi:hypothetical protein
MDILKEQVKLKIKIYSMNLFRKVMIEWKIIRKINILIGK